MLQELAKLFTSGFVFPNLPLLVIALVIGICIVFGVIWLIGYRPPIFKKPWVWVLVAANSAMLTWTAICFLQSSLQSWTNQALVYFLGMDTYMEWILVASIPSILLSGLVQESAKLVPVVSRWLHNNRKMNARTGLIMGAIAGAGFGVFEAVWVLNTYVFAPGWNWGMVASQGLVALLPFVERFFAIALHIGCSALAGYGLAKGWGRQFYLIAAFVHGLTNYSVILFQMHILTPVQMEIWIAVISTVLTAVVLWLRWRGSVESVDEGALNATLTPLKLKRSSYASRGQVIV
jgi:RsiW-degrading membrane proteinase PrsW (M82 family)